MNTIILIFYKYVDIEYPERTKKWQKKICQELGLRGRVLIAPEGINATVGGTRANIEHYKKIMHEHPLFSDIDFKESNGDIECFSRMQVVVKKQIINFGIDPTIVLAKNGGIHLTPQQVHTLIAQQPNDLIIFDVRNKAEWKIGRFVNAITPDINHFRQLPTFIDQHLSLFKDKQVLMNCTAGIRCEPASAYLKSKGVAKEVYQLRGGIHRYIEQYPDGFFRGKNYVFDGRLAIKANDDILATCDVCSVACDDYTNCLNAKCNKHFICCAQCLQQLHGTCSAQCLELIQTEQVPQRPPLKKAPVSNVSPISKQ